MRAFIVFLFLLLFFSLIAQPEYDAKRDFVWILGDNDDPNTGEYKGLLFDFKGDSLELTQISQAFFLEGTNSSLCDESGNLLIYSNGCSVADGNHNLVMEVESVELCSTGVPHGLSSHNYSILLPVNEGKDFYLFTYDQVYISGIDWYPTFSLHKIEKHDDSILVVENNVLLLGIDYNLCMGKLAACRHGNGLDWWIIMGQKENGNFIRYLLTADGLSGPYFQEIGFPYSGRDSAYGALVFSPDGNKMISYSVNADLQIFDVDRCTGELFNPIHIKIEDTSDVYRSGGVAVSSNSRYLYVASSLYVYQYDLLAENIEESMIIVAEYDNYRSPWWSRAMAFNQARLAPDEKIYITASRSRTSLHVIESPNNQGLSCNLVQHKLNLSTRIGTGLPNFPDFRLGVLEDNPCDTIVFINEFVDEEIKNISLEIHPNPAKNKIKITTSKSIDNWKIIDVSRKIMLKGGVIKKQKDISISDLNNGTYFFIAGYGSGKTKTIKLIKMQ